MKNYRDYEMEILNLKDQIKYYRDLKTKQEAKEDFLRNCLAGLENTIKKQADEIEFLKHIIEHQRKKQTIRHKIKDVLQFLNRKRN